MTKAKSRYVCDPRDKINKSLHLCPNGRWLYENNEGINNYLEILQGHVEIWNFFLIAQNILWVQSTAS